MITVLAYILAIAAAEVMGSFTGVIYGILVHTGLITLLLGHFFLKEEAPYRWVLPVLLLAPLLRILSAVMPIKQLPQIDWYGLVAIPLLVAAALTVRLLSFTGAHVGLRVYSKLPQVLIALSGLPLSIAAFFILRPEPLISGYDWPAILIGSAILATSTGFVEEFIFRGLLQNITVEAFGDRASIFISSTLFMIMYIGSLSVSYLSFIGLVGLFFGYCANRTRSIWGVVLAHSIMNVGMAVIWPAVANSLG